MQFCKFTIMNFKTQIFLLRLLQTHQGQRPNLGGWGGGGHAVLECLPSHTKHCYQSCSCNRTGCFLLKHKIWPWLVWRSGLSTDLQTKGSPVRFPVRVNAWVAGQVPSRGRARGNYRLMFLSLSSPLPSPLKISK